MAPRDRMMVPRLDLISIEFSLSLRMTPVMLPPFLSVTVPARAPADRQTTQARKAAAIGAIPRRKRSFIGLV